MMSFPLKLMALSPKITRVPAEYLYHRTCTEFNDLIAKRSPWSYLLWISVTYLVGVRSLGHTPNSASSPGLPVPREN